MTRCLITGASGFIGSGVLEYLMEKTDWEFTCICSWRHRGNPLNIKPDPRVEVITHDLTGPIPELGDFDFILNLASESHVDRSIAEPVSFIENNVSSTLQVLEYARNHKDALKVFIQFSTDEVYGATKHEQWDVLLPSNPYAASKAAQEMICIAYWRTYFLPIIITNSNNIIGKNQDKEKFVPKIVDLINQNREVEIHVSNGQPGVRYYNPVQNVADALLYMLKHIYPQRYIKEADPRKQVNRPWRYNLGGGEKMDNLEMAQLIADIMGRELIYKLVDAESVRQGYDEFYPKTEGVLDTADPSILVWEPPYTLREGLAWLSQ